METIYLTRAGVEKLRRDLENLVKVVRPEATEQLSRARDHGDLSENAEYDAAKEQISSIDRQIVELQIKLGNVQIISEQDFHGDEIGILCKVKLLDLKKNKEVEWTLVDPVQSDPTISLISIQSPIGKGLLGKKINDVVVINVPAGELKFKVLTIKPAEGL